MTSARSIRDALTGADVARCFPVMVQLRPQLTEPEFVARVLRQRSQGYRLAFIETDGRVTAVAGYRFGENLAWGRHLYVDDLVTDESVRSTGEGGALFDWLVGEARAAGCAQFHLDSGVLRFGAHGFYLSKRMRISSHHFVMDLTPPR